jgi:hypothetical protein
MCILFTLVLIILLIIYLSNADQEGFTSSIRGLYNPKKRQIRMYREKITRQVNEYINNLKKTFSWA